MQSEIINEIIEVEDEASAVVDKAKTDANMILNKADVKSKKIVKDSVKQCKLENQSTYDALIEKNTKEVIVFQESLKEDYTKSSFNYKKVTEELAKKICSLSVFEV
jgi:vacuolar-type H+-ATPase subunit H